MVRFNYFALMVTFMHFFYESQEEEVIKAFTTEKIT